MKSPYKTTSVHLWLMPALHPLSDSSGDSSGLLRGFNSAEWFLINPAD